MWLALTAKRRWEFKLPPLNVAASQSVHQPLLMSPRAGRSATIGGGGHPNGNHQQEDIYWPKLTPSSPKLKVTFNEIPSTSSDHHDSAEHEGKR